MKNQEFGEAIRKIPYFVAEFQVSSPSIDPTLKVGDLIVFSILNNTFRAADNRVVKPNCECLSFLQYRQMKC